MSINRIVYSPILFSMEQIKEINKEIQTKYITDESIEASHLEAATLKTAKTNHIPCAPMMEYLNPFISFIQGTNMTLFGCDLFFYLNVESFNYNVYEGKRKAKYDWHSDGSPDGQPIDIKLTCLLNLSEDTYEGGDLLISPDFHDPEEEKYNEIVGRFRTPGTAIIFHPQRAHKVTPITKGKRITLTYWAEGPAWK